MNRKVSPKYFDGIKFIMMSDLPPNQVSMFSDWVSSGSFIPRRVGNERLIKYEDYEIWYDLYYATEKDLDQYL